MALNIIMTVLHRGLCYQNIGDDFYDVIVIHKKDFKKVLLFRTGIFVVQNVNILFETAILPRD